MFKKDVYSFKANTAYSLMNQLWRCQLRQILRTLVIQAKIFAYNEDKKAIIKDPNGGPFEDFVKAAEKCTAGVIHPGLPAADAKGDLTKLIARAEKYN